MPKKRTNRPKRKVKSKGSAPEKMTRKMKKQLRKRRSLQAKSVRKACKLKRKINEVAWGFAYAVAGKSSGNEDVMNRLGFCPDCKMNYCFNFVGGISWCHECSVSHACLKLNYPEDALFPADAVIVRQCKPCHWDEQDMRMNQ